MKKLSKSELDKLAAQMFDYHKTVDKFFATEDGQFFTEANKGAARMHAKDHQIGLFEYTRDGKVAEQNADPKVPDESWKKDDILKWCQEHEIAFGEKETKAELLKRIEEALN